MSATSRTAGEKVIVELTCDFCGAEVVHADTASLQTVSAYLSAAGWVLLGWPPQNPQTTCCPRCAIVGGAHASQPQPALQEAAHS